MQIIKDGGDATSPDYAEKICRIIVEWRLMRWDGAAADTGNVPSKPAMNEKRITDVECPFFVRVSLDYCTPI